MNNQDCITRVQSQRYADKVVCQQVAIIACFIWQMPLEGSLILPNILISKLSQIQLLRKLNKYNWLDQLMTFLLQVVIC